MSLVQARRLCPQAVSSPAARSLRRVQRPVHAIFACYTPCQGFALDEAFLDVARREALVRFAVEIGAITCASPRRSAGGGRSGAHAVSRQAGLRSGRSHGQPVGGHALEPASCSSLPRATNWPSSARAGVCPVGRWTGDGGQVGATRGVRPSASWLVCPGAALAAAVGVAAARLADLAWGSDERSVQTGRDVKSLRP